MALLVIKPQGTPPFTAVSVYAPTRGSDENDITEFWEELQRMVDEHAVGRVFIGGDMNTAREGTDVNGDLFRMFLAQDKLFSFGHRFSVKRPFTFWRDKKGVGLIIFVLVLHARRSCQSDM